MPHPCRAYLAVLNTSAGDPAHPVHLPTTIGLSSAYDRLDQPSSARSYNIQAPHVAVARSLFRDVASRFFIAMIATAMLVFCRIFRAGPQIEHGDSTGRDLAAAVKIRPENIQKLPP
jgi:hypothetical protein